MKSFMTLRSCPMCHHVTRDLWLWPLLECRTLESRLWSTSWLEPGFRPCRSVSIQRGGTSSESCQECSTQIVFLDTPGLVTSGHCHRHSLEQTFLSHPVQGSRIADLILVVVDASNKRERERLNRGILDQLRRNPDKTSALVINKVDAVGSKRRLIDISTRLSEGHIDGKPLPRVRVEDHLTPPTAVQDHRRLMEDHLTPPTAVQEHRRLNNIEQRVRRKGHIVDIENIVNAEGEPEEDRIGWKNFDRVFMLSALDGDGVDGLRDYLVSRAVPRPWTYHPSLITPLPPSQIVYNAVREKLLEYLPQEIPYTIVASDPVVGSNQVRNDSHLSRSPCSQV